jgi:hypothetical protein
MFVTVFDIQCPDKIENIYKGEHVLDLIIEGRGTNELVEQNRGLTKSLDDLPIIGW